jgi:hypothetical protein
VDGLSLLGLDVAFRHVPHKATFLLSPPVCSCFQPGYCTVSVFGAGGWNQPHAGVIQWPGRGDNRRDSDAPSTVILLPLLEIDLSAPIKSFSPRTRTFFVTFNKRVVNVPQCAEGRTSRRVPRHALPCSPIVPTNAQTLWPMLRL